MVVHLTFILNNHNAEAPTSSIADLTAANIDPWKFLNVQAQLSSVITEYKALSMHPASVLLKQIRILK